MPWYSHGQLKFNLNIMFKNRSGSLPRVLTITPNFMKLWKLNTTTDLTFFISEWRSQHGSSLRTLLGFLKDYSILKVQPAVSYRHPCCWKLHCLIVSLMRRMNSREKKLAVILRALFYRSHHVPLLCGATCLFLIWLCLEQDGNACFWEQPNSVTAYCGPSFLSPFLDFGHCLGEDNDL